MINVKKGTAHSLQQSDTRGAWLTGVTAGMFVHVDATGTIAIGAPLVNSDGSQGGISGFAINDSTDGDALESGKIAVYTLDGNSVIETDQCYNADTTTSPAAWKIGQPVYAIGKSVTGAGKVTVDLTTGAITGGVPIGWVEGIRNLQADGNVSNTQNYVKVDGTTGSNTAGIQKNIPVVAIKLAATTAQRTA